MLLTPHSTCPKEHFKKIEDVSSFRIKMVLASFKIRIFVKIQLLNLSVQHCSSFLGNSALIYKHKNVFPFFHRYRPRLVIITPTYNRTTQIAELVRMKQTLSVVPDCDWIIIEDSLHINPEVLNYIDDYSSGWVSLV